MTLSRWPLLLRTTNYLKPSGVYSNYPQLTVQFMIVVSGYIEVLLLDHLVKHCAHKFGYTKFMCGIFF